MSCTVPQLALWIAVGLAIGFSAFVAIVATTVYLMDDRCPDCGTCLNCHDVEGLS